MQCLKNKFLNFAYRCRNVIAVLNKLDASGVSILSLKKHAFADRVFIHFIVSL